MLVAVTAAVGFYRGWFTVSRQSGNGTEQLTGTVDKDKIEADKKRAAEELRRLGEHKSGSEPGPAKD